MTFRPLVLLVLWSLQASASADPSERFIDDAAIKADFETHLGTLFQAGGLPAASSLAEQLRKATAAPIPVPANAGPETGPSLDPVARARNATLVLGHLYLCGKCDNYHGNVAGGVIISPDGLVLTNYHVMDAKEAIVFGAMTAEGQIFGIERVLAASKRDDVALVKLLDAKDLPCVPLSPRISAGDELFVLSHPDGHFYTLTRGYLARKYLIPREQVQRLQITADFAKGSSGSGIFNVRGELIGLATSTNSIYYSEKNGVKDNLQMVVKSGVPVESIRQLFSGAPLP
jgi:S1-C subfamily serine protease